MKRTLSFLITVFLLFQMALTVGAAETDVFFRFGDALGKPGDEVTVTLYMDGAADFNTAALNGLVYDDEVLTFLGFSEHYDISEDPVMKDFNRDEQLIILCYSAADVYSGYLCDLKFRINTLDVEKPGDYTVSMTPIVKNSAAVLTSAAAAGTVTVQSETEDDEWNVSYKHSCSFENDLTLNYYIAADELDGCTDIVLNLTREYYDGGERRQKDVEIPAQFVEAEESKIGEAAYKFSYSGIAACEIGDIITAKVTAVKDGKPVSGQEDIYSVKQYAYSRLEKTDDADFRTLLVDLLNYAAEAQKYFNYDTEHLVNAGLTDEQKAYGTAALPEIDAEEKLTDIENAVVEFYAKSCVFNSNVELKYYLSIPREESTDGMYIRFRYMPTRGEERVIDIPASEFHSEWIRKKDSDTEKILCQTVKLTGIAAPDMGKIVSAQVFRGDGTPLSGVQEYSIEIYGKSRLEKSADEDFRSLIGAMLKYARTANAYFISVK